MRLSTDEIEDIRRMLPTHSIRQIAAYIGCHRNTVWYWSRRLCAEAPHLTGGRPYREVPLALVATVRERITAGDSYRRIAADLRRDEGTIAAIAASVGLSSRHPALGARS